MKIYIIVLHYGEVDNTLHCLESIGKLDNDKFQLRTVIVDNDVENRFTRSLVNARDDIIIQTNKNLGFAGGVNVGVREALSDKDCTHILILNNDTILPKDLLIKLLENKSGVTGPVVKFKWDGKWKYDFGGRIDWNIGRTYHLESDNLTMKQFSKEKIDYVSGCCMLISREVFEKIGLFDEKFFFYFEDTDFCVRAKKTGFTIGICTDTNIEHKLGGSVGRWSNKAIFYNLSSNAIFITKHLGWRRPLGFGYLLLLTGKIIFDKLTK